jgi:hypothetical protein
MRANFTRDEADRDATARDQIETTMAKAAGSHVTYLDSRTAQSLVRVKDGILVRRFSLEREAVKWCQDRGIKFTSFRDLTEAEQTRIMFA